MLTFLTIAIGSLDRVAIGYDKGTIIVKNLSSHSWDSRGLQVEKEYKKECWSFLSAATSITIVNLCVIW